MRKAAAMRSKADVCRIRWLRSTINQVTLANKCRSITGCSSKSNTYSDSVGPLYIVVFKVRVRKSFLDRKSH